MNQKQTRTLIYMLLFFAFSFSVGLFWVANNSAKYVEFQHTTSGIGWIRIEDIQTIPVREIRPMINLHLALIWGLIGFLLYYVSLLVKEAAR